MPTYPIKLKNREEVASGTMAFHFEKPEGFVFKSGQHADFTLLNPPETDAEGNSRTFSLVSAPHENELVFATRMRDTAFKRVLKTMPLGTELTLEGPFGSMTLQNDVSRPAVFLAGGIGITPFISMVRHATEQKLSHKIFLFYSNRKVEDAPFLSELQNLEKQNLNFKLIATMTGSEKSEQSWIGERGYINKEMLAKYIRDISKPVYYLAGPPQMVLVMREMLNNAGIDDDNIRSEEFGGY
ncbi:MAG: FAD-dependent oxidoreductase [Patescibacteria group bacterium]